MKSMDYFARATLDRLRQQPLREHLQNVACLAQRFANEACFGNTVFSQAAYLLGLLHDIGKYRQEFQALLAGKRQRDTETAHSVYGAAAAYTQFGMPMHAFAIAGHHAGLYDASSLNLLLQGSKFTAQERFPELIKIASQPSELDCLPRTPQIRMALPFTT